jgi:hypothetical protein
MHTSSLLTHVCIASSSYMGYLDILRTRLRSTCPWSTRKTSQVRRMWASISVMHSKLGSGNSKPSTSAKIPEPPRCRYTGQEIFYPKTSPMSESLLSVTMLTLSSSLDGQTIMGSASMPLICLMPFGICARSPRKR